MRRPSNRQETRHERYAKKLEEAIGLPVSLVTINFHCDDNLAYLIRTAACFGVNTIYVIGSIPSRKALYNPSGSLVDYVELVQFSRPSQFLEYARQNNIRLVSAELDSRAVSLFNYSFNFNHHTAIVLGNESTGVPAEILMRSDKVYIPMLGLGFCLNTSQTGTAFISEYCRQYACSQGD